MLSVNEDALVCDLAETYGILDYRALPVRLLATLAAGLRDDSRIKMQIRGEKLPQNTLLLGAAVDKLAFLAWANSTDGQQGVNRPASLVRAMLGMDMADESAVAAFDTAEEFEAARAKILGVNHGN